MPRGTCEPCCNPSELARSEATFRTGSLIILCDILSALGGGSQSFRYDWELLCDPSDGSAVFVRFGYDTTGGQEATTAYNADGTPYVGSVAALVSCNEFWQSGGSSGGTSMQDDTPFTVGTTDFTPAGGTYRSVRDSVNDNDGGAFAMTATRALYTSIETPSGDSAMDEVNDALRVNVVAGSSGGPGKIDDSAFGIGVDSVNPIGALADETAPDSVNEGDVGLVRMSLNRVLFNIIRDAAGNERGANVTAANELMVNVGNATLAVTQSGTWNINNISGTISLPTGASTSALQTTGNTSLATIAGAVSGTEMQVDVITMPPITATNLDIRDLVFATDKVDVTGSTVAATQSGTWNINNISGTISLPTGAATSTNQTSMILALQLIDDIVKTDDTAFTPAVDKVAMIGAEFDDTGTDSVDEGDAGAIRMSANRNLYMRIRDNAGNERGANVTAASELLVSVNNATLAVTQSGTWNINNISGTISLPTGASTLAEQQTQTTALQLIDNLVFVDDAAFTPGTTSIVMAGGTYRSARDSVDNNDGGAFAMTQTRALYTSIETPLGDSAMDDTNDALRVNVVAGSVGGPGKVDDSAFSIGVDSVNPIGALADETAPDSVNEGDVGLVRMSLNRVLFNIIRDAAGNERGANVTAANELLVSVNNATLAVTQSGTWNINNISGTISLPTGASTSALQTTGNTSLATIAGAVAGTEMQVDVITLPPITATNLDIRDLVFATDKVDVTGSTVAATQSGTWNINNISGTISLPTGASTLAEQQTQTTALQLIDNIVLTEDSAHSSGASGVFALTVRMDTPANLSTTDGDYEGLQVSAGLLWTRVRGIQTPLGDSAMDDTNDALRVNVVAGSVGGPGKVDDSAFSIGVDSVNPIGALADETGPDSVNEGDVGLVRMSLNRVLFNIIRDAAGNERGANVTAANELLVSVNNATLAVTQSGTWNINNISGTISLPTGASTSALQTTGNTSLATIAGAVSGTEMQVDVLTLPPVTATNLDIRDLVFATDKVDVTGSVVASTQSGTWNITNISGTVSLPTGASTSANQTTIITSLQLLDDVVKTDDSAFTPGTDKVAMIGAEFDNTAPDSVDEGDAGALRMSANRSLYINIRDNAGNERGLNIDASGRLTEANSATIVAALSSIIYTDGVDTPTEILVIGGVDTNTGFAGSFVVDTGRLLVSGGDAQDAVLGFNPVAIGGLASTAVPGSVGSDGDAQYVWLTRFGAVKTVMVDDAGDSIMDGTNNALRVNLVAGGGSGGTSMVDDAAFTPGTTAFTPAGGTYRSSRDSVDDNDGGAFAMTQTRALYTSIETPAGQSAIDDTADAVRVMLRDGVGDSCMDDANNSARVTIVSGNAQPLEDSALGSTPQGNLMMARRDDVLSTLTPIEDDAVSIRVNSLGALWTTIQGINTPNGDSAMDDTNDALRVNVVAGSSGGPSKVDDSAFGIGTDTVAPMGALADETGPDSVDEGDVGIPRMSLNRNLYFQLRDASGAERGANVNASGQLSVSVNNAAYVEDSVHSSGEQGLFTLGVRNDALATRTSQDGDYGAFSVDLRGAIFTASTVLDDAAFTPGTSYVSMVGATFDDASPDSVNEGDGGALRMSANRNLYNTIRDAAGNERGANVTAANELLVSIGNATLAVTQSGTWNINNISGTISLPTGASTLAEQQSQTTALQLIDNIVFVDDAAFTAGTTSIVMAGFTFDDATPDSVNEGDGGAARMSANRNIYTTIRDAAGNERGVNVNASNQLSVSADAVVPGTGATNLGKAEDAAHTTGDVGVMALAVSNEANTARAADGDYIPLATDTEGNARIVGNRDHDAVDAGEVVKVGGVAVSGSATPTPVAAADRVRWIFNQSGVPYVMAGHPNLITREYDFGSASQTDVNLAAAAVAADERVYVTRLEITCDNANTGAVSARAGFGTANVPAASSTGVSGMLASHPGIAPGSGLVCGSGAGLIGVGAAGEEPRITTSAASANTHVLISYYLLDETP